MFAYCGNNPVNACDPTGELPVWVIPGLIGATTNVCCAYISGERGIALLDDALSGLASGFGGKIAQLISIAASIKTGYEFAQESNSVLGGIAIGVFSYGVSQFTGENVSKIKVNGVQYVKMTKDSEMWLFDAVFGYLANIFATQAIIELTPVQDTQYSDVSNSSHVNNIPTRASATSYYRNKTNHLLGIN